MKDVMADTTTTTATADNIVWDSVESEIDEAEIVAAMQAALRSEYAELADL